MSISRAVDVVVVGAGPAGCAAAIDLGRSGLEVVLVDRARFPRDKCCGDGLTTGALRRLEALGLNTSAVASFTPLSELALRSPSGRVARLPLGNGSGCFGAVARRRDLDAALVDLARPLVEVVEGVGFLGLEPTADRAALEVTFDQGLSLRTRYVVAADGAWSRVRKAARAFARQPEQVAPAWYAFRAYVRDVDPSALERLWVLFDERVLPGYIWSFPVGDAVNLGVCVERSPSESGAQLAAAWTAALGDSFVHSLLGRRAYLESPARAWPIPAGVQRESLSDASGRVLFVGDAAYASDPFTGEGIAQALETGALAARAVAQQPDDGRSVARAYTEETLVRLGRDHAISWRLRRLLGSSAGARAAVRASGSRLTRREVGRWLYEDYPRAIALTPSLWRRAARTTKPPYLGTAR